MVVAFAKPFSRPELWQASNTSPGLFELSYQLLKHVPSACLDHFFRRMHYLWQENKHVLEFWKLKGLYSIPKEAVPIVTSATDLRPIGLIEVTCKLWIISATTFNLWPGGTWESRPA